MTPVLWIIEFSMCQHGEGWGWASEGYGSGVFKPPVLILVLVLALPSPLGLHLSPLPPPALLPGSVLTWLRGPSRVLQQLCPHCL